MDLSKKIILAFCACVAVGALSCTVEDRDIETKDVFWCSASHPCLEGSTCVYDYETNKNITKDEDKIGKCVRNREVNHCHDNDGDGFYAADKDYESECNFSEKSPKDLNDDDPTVNPNSTEICDTRDNTGDGCVDGICTKNDGSGTCQGECLPLMEACAGRRNNFVTEDNSACNVLKTGVNVCQNGNMVYATVTKCDPISYDYLGKKIDTMKCQYNVEASGACKKDNYEKIEVSCNDGIDNDCNGAVDECKKTCKFEDNEERFCYIFMEENAVEYSIGRPSGDISDWVNCSSEENCDCVGELTCNDEGMKVCKNKSGNVIDKTVTLDCLNLPSQTPED